jgi:MFS superfamily sulfate permease-like transporter
MSVRLGEKGIKIVGELPIGMPKIGLPHIQVSDISELIPIALACFMLAYGEAISVARSFAQKHGYDVNPEQELTALGAANLATGLAQGFPVVGGMSQTAVNDMGGATSPLALVVTSGAIALTLAFFAKLFHNLPEPVLAAIVLMAASHLVRIDDLRQLRLASRPQFRLALLAFAGVLLFGLLDGLLLAAIGSLTLVIAYASRPPVVILGREPITGQYVNKARYPEAEDTPGALVIRSIRAWLYFNAEYIRHRILELVDAPRRTSGPWSRIVRSFRPLIPPRVRRCGYWRDRSNRAKLPQHSPNCGRRHRKSEVHGCRAEHRHADRSPDNRRVFGAVTGRRRPADRRVTVNSAANIALPYCSAVRNDAF